LLTDRQTDKQTYKRWAKHILIGRGNDRKFITVEMLSDASL